MRALVTGGAGFIGSHLVDRLLARGDDVTVLDNFSTGQEEFLADARRSGGLRLIRGDLADPATLAEATADQETVFHFAANADVRRGLENPYRDLEQNTLGTFRVLEAMRASGVRRLVFASTGSVYGEPEVFPTPESCPFPVQTSLYGAAKLAGEALASAYAHGYGFEVVVLRLVSVLGPRYHHGHVIDFCRRLRADPTTIEVLGDGRQRKSYLQVDDAIAAVLLATERSPGPLDIYNVGLDEHCSVDESLSWICERMDLRPRRCYSGGTRGWPGDSPFVLLDTGRIRGLGWRPRWTLRAAIGDTLDYLLANPWLFARGDR